MPRPLVQLGAWLKGNPGCRVAFRFDLADQTTEAAVRRIAIELLTRGISPVKQLVGPPESSVHEFRKSVKKCRALIRLVRDGLDDYDTWNAALRDAGRMLANARDNEILIATFSRLKGEAAETDQPPLARAEAALGMTAGTPRSLPVTQEAAEAIRALCDHAAGWSVSGKGFAAITEGLASGWRKAKSAQDHARRECLADDVHEWRKRVKDHWYHARILRPIWPEGLAPHIAAADALGEFLGYHHDLELLTRHVIRQDLADDDRQAVLRIIADHQRDVAGRALILGDRLFAGSAAALVDRWGDLWHLWRKGV
jgi:CHAD domain-containing protein